MARFDLTLDVSKTALIPQTVKGRMGDNETLIISAAVTSGGAALSMTGKSVRFECTKPDGCTVRDPSPTVSGSTVTYAVPDEVLSCGGVIKDAYFRIVGPGEQVESTEAFVIDVQEAISGYLPSYYLNDVDAAIARLTETDEDASRNEEARVSAESARTEAEETRRTAETARKSAETKRANAESARESAEAARAEAEAGRAQAEDGRVAAETARATAEAARAASFSEMEARSRGWLRYICQPGEFDPVTLEPTVSPADSNTLYYVPTGEGGSNQFEEWTWVVVGDEGHWERFGVTEMSFSPITTAQVDEVAGDESPSGAQVLTLSGLSYLWQKLKATFAAIAHKHAGTDINAGTLPRTAIDESFEDEIASLESSRDSVSQKWTLGTGVVNASLQNPNANTQSGKQIGIQLTYADGERMLLYTDYDLGICLYNHTTSSRVYLIPRKRLLYSGSSQIASGHTLTIDKQAWLSKCNRVLVCGWVGSGGCRFSYELPTGNCNILAAGIDSGSALVAARINVNTTGEQVVITNSGVANVGAPPVVISQVYAWHD